MHFRRVSKSKKAKPSDDATTPGTVMAAKIRDHANKLTDSERAALMGNACASFTVPKGTRRVLVLPSPLRQPNFQRNLAAGIRLSVC